MASAYPAWWDPGSTHSAPARAVSGSRYVRQPMLRAASSVSRCQPLMPAYSVPLARPGTTGAPRSSAATAPSCRARLRLTGVLATIIGA